MAGPTNPDPGEQKHIITGRLVDWATRDGGGAGQAADAVRSVLDEFLPGRYLSSVLNSAPRKQRSGAERTAARGHGEGTQTRSGQRAGRRRPRSRPGARGGGPVRRLREGAPSNPTHRAPARDRRRVHRRPSRHPQGRPGPGGPGHSGPRRRTMPATYADRRPPTTGYATVRSPCAISTATGASSLPNIRGDVVVRPARQRRPDRPVLCRARGGTCPIFETGAVPRPHRAERLTDHACRQPRYHRGCRTMQRGGRSAFGWPHPGNGVAFSLQTVRGGGRAPVRR